MDRINIMRHRQMCQCWSVAPRHVEAYEASERSRWCETWSLQSGGGMHDCHTTCVTSIETEHFPQGTQTVTLRSGENMTSSLSHIFMMSRAQRCMMGML